MNYKFTKQLLMLLMLFAIKTTGAQTMYFPPKLGSGWDTLSPQSLNWCMDKIDTLYNYLEKENTKAFLVLKDGKIVLEKYFGTFTADSSWYWASAGKTITAFLVGQAQEQGLLSVNDSTSKYLGSGWTSCSAEQESKITIKHQLQMTTGLDDAGDVFCTDANCLNYLAEPGTRWSYHNAPYTLLTDVIESASGVTENAFTTTNLKVPIGMKGLWIRAGYNNIYFSQPRSMARFGLLIQNGGIWENDTLMHDKGYFNQMINTSQQLNKSYGYLWWLNGKQSYMVPGSQVIIPGSYAPDAPADMYSALGKNGQILSISPSKGIVIVRMGDAPGGSILDVSTIFTNNIWKKLQEAMCVSNPVLRFDEQNKISVYPNPANNRLNVGGLGSGEIVQIQIQSLNSQEVLIYADAHSTDISTLAPGLYIARISVGNEVYFRKFVKFSE